jgi:hypothetical protein
MTLGQVVSNLHPFYQLAGITETRHLKKFKLPAGEAGASADKTPLA